MIREREREFWAAIVRPESLPECRREPCYCPYNSQKKTIIINLLLSNNLPRIVQCESSPAMSRTGRGNSCRPHCRGRLVGRGRQKGLLKHTASLFVDRNSSIIIRELKERIVKARTESNFMHACSWKVNVPAELCRPLAAEGGAGRPLPMRNSSAPDTTAAWVDCIMRDEEVIGPIWPARKASECCLIGGGGGIRESCNTQGRLLFEWWALQEGGGGWLKNVIKLRGDELLNEKNVPYK